MVSNMSIESVAFFHGWMTEFITDAERGGSSARAMMLAGQCRDAAALLGMSIDDEPERGSVESIIHARMLTPKRDEEEFWKVWWAMRGKLPLN